MGPSRLKSTLLRKVGLHKDLLGLLPITGWEIFFYLIPLIFLLLVSFWTTKDYRVEADWNLKNYITVFTNPLVRVAFLRSLAITFSTLIITIVAAYPFAYGLVFKLPKRYRQLVLIAIIAPF